MIIKIISMAVVIASSALIGRYFANCGKTRSDELFNLADSVEFLQNELEYSMEPVEVLFYKSRDYAKGYSEDVFEQVCLETSRGKTVGQAWGEAIEYIAHSMHLTKDDVDYLKNCSDVFDAYEASRQMSQFKILKDKIRYLAQNALNASEKNGKLYKMLGFYGGVLICTVLF